MADFDDDDRQAVRRLIQIVGDDDQRAGLLETPDRVLKAWRFFGSGYTQQPDDILKTFNDGAEGVDEMVVVGSIPVWSNCEHHMLPFFGVAHIAYLPKERILGLSKFVRLIDIFARRLQVQERLTQQVADALQKGLAPMGCGVVLQCRHMCMEARGVQRSGSITQTTALRGCFKEPHVKAEFLQTIRGQGNAG